MKGLARSFSPSGTRLSLLLAAWLIPALILIHFSGIAYSAQATLEWDPSPDPSVSGYKIYYGFETGNYAHSIDVGNTLLYTITGLEENRTVYFAATAYDTSGVESDFSKEVSFRVENQLPVADAGPEQTVDQGVVTTLSGTNSSDPEGRTLSYFWEQTRGTAVALSDPYSPEPVFTTPEVGINGETLTFRLTVTDDMGQKAEDYCTVNVSWVNEPPLADAGPDMSVDEGEEVLLDGSMSADPDDGIISYLWEQTSGPQVGIMNPGEVEASFIAPNLAEEGVSLSFRLTVKDNGGLISTDTCVVNVTWSNTPPVADAGDDQTVFESETVLLDASASWDPDDGIATVRWTQTGGTPVSLSDPAGRQPKFIAPEVTDEGEILTFQVTVTDIGGLMSQDLCTVTVNPRPRTVPPAVAIRANGSDERLVVSRFSPVSITISVDPAGYEGKEADFWLVADTPYGRFYKIYNGAWGTSQTPFLQYPIGGVEEIEVFNGTLSKGAYTFYFAIDDNSDGLLDATWVDTVSVKVW